MKRLYEAPEMDIKDYLQREPLSIISDPDLDNKDHWIEVPLG